MKREHHLVKTKLSPSTVELYVNGDFVSSWHIPQDSSNLKIDTAEAMIKEAYAQGYKAARRDLNEWLTGA